jgi:hypothetical protein
MSNLFLFLFSWLLYFIWTMPEMPMIKNEVTQEDYMLDMCPSLPENYFVVETVEKVTCDVGTEKSVLTKIIREARVVE